MREVAWRRAAALAPGDTRAITRNLGFFPSNVHSVAARDTSDAPTVLQMYPLSTSLNGSPGRRAVTRGSGPRVQPWTTLFWLVCPTLRSKISKLEAVGFIPYLQASISEHPALMHGMVGAHARYADARWTSLVESDQELACEIGWEARLRETGVGGMVGTAQLKCLHMHCGHYLATGDNPAGRWVSLALEEELAETAGALQRECGQSPGVMLDASLRSSASSLLMAIERECSDAADGEGVLPNDH
ncbi:hypothetical protein T492DRAFT_964810 [Pavlovales sp. CCMP2436]|nr:hypothetical protein T492DRAFT_964810 [Pavlovales sp. CCMP2436]